MPYTILKTYCIIEEELILEFPKYVNFCCNDVDSYIMRQNRRFFSSKLRLQINWKQIEKLIYLSLISLFSRAK